MNGFPRSLWARSVIGTWTGSVLLLSGCGQSSEEPETSPSHVSVQTAPATPQPTPAAAAAVNSPVQVLLAPGEPEKSSGFKLADPEVRPASQTTEELPSIIEPNLLRTASISQEPRTPAELFETILQAQRDGDGSKWESTQTRLINLGSQAMPILVRQLASADPERKDLAAMLMPCLGAPSAEHSSQLLRALSDGSDSVRANIAATLSQAEQHPDQVVPVLIQLLNCGVENLELQAAYTVGNYRENAADAVIPLVEKLTKASPHMQQAILGSLGQMGNAARSAIPVLQAFRNQADEETRVTLQVAIDQILSARY